MSSTFSPDIGNDVPDMSSSGDEKIPSAGDANILPPK